jgi:hypothetical protein
MRLTPKVGTISLSFGAFGELFREAFFQDAERDERRRRGAARIRVSRNEILVDAAMSLRISPLAPPERSICPSSDRELPSSAVQMRTQRIIGLGLP